MYAAQLWKGFALSFMHCEYIFWKGMNDLLPLNPCWHNYFQRVTLSCLFFSLKIEKWDSLWPGKGKCSGEVGKGFAHSIAEVSLIGAEYVRHKGWTTETISLGRTLVPFIWLPIKYGKFSSHCCLCQQTARKAIGLNSAMLCAKTMIFLASFPKIPLICDYYDLICIYIHVLLLENNMCEKVEENYTQRHISVLFKNFLTKSLPKIKITKSDLS